MFGKRPVFSCGAAVVLACFALFGAGSASAKIFRTSASVQDFRFDGLGDVLYSNPSLDQVSMTLSEDNQVVLTAVGNAAVSTDPEGVDRVGKLQLTLDEDGGRSQPRYYLQFGSLLDQSSASTGYLVNGVMDAMESGRDQEGGLMFLFAGEVTGVRGTEYQRYGLYSDVAGVDDVQWISQHDASASALNLVVRVASEPDLASPAAPIPATSVLLLAGLIGLRLARRRGRSS